MPEDNDDLTGTNTGENTNDGGDNTGSNDGGDNTNNSNEDKIELSSANEWAQLLGDENKNNTEVTKFKTVDELASAYGKLKAEVGTGKRLEPLTDSATTDEVMESSTKLFNVTEDSYSEDFKHKDLAYKFKLPSKLIEPFIKEIGESTEKTSKAEESKTLAKYKEEILSKEPEETFQTRFDAGLKALGLTREEYQKELPTLVRNKPKLVLSIVELGKKQFTKGENKEIDNDSELPSDLGILSNHIADLARQRMKLKLQGRDHFQIDEQLKKYKMRHKVVLQKTKQNELNQATQLA